MNGEPLGIETLKQAALVAAKFGQRLEKVLEDKKVTWSEGLGLFFGTVPDALQLVPNVKQIIPEYKDLSPAEREELVDYIATNLDLASDKVEGIVEQAFKVLAEIDELIEKIRE